MNNDVFISNATKIQLEIPLLKNTWFADVSSINLPVGKALVMVKNKHGYGRISQHGGQSHWPQSSSLFEPSLFE